MRHPRFASLSLLMMLGMALPAWADDLEELRAQLQQLRDHFETQQREQERQRTELLAAIQSLEAKIASTDSTDDTRREAPHASGRRFSHDRPAALARWLESPSPPPPAPDVLGAIIERKALMRQTASGQYGDPASFFLLHGYTTVTYADFQRGLNAAPGSAEQILIAGTSARSGKHTSGFKNDTALFIGSELTPQLDGMFEVHFVGNARDPVITESKMTWGLVEPTAHQPSLRIVAGRYWWPFGIHDQEWFSALNAFNLQSPAATEVVPAHYNELGLMLEGGWLVHDPLGLNYLVSVGNGVSSFELSDNVGSANAFDADANRSVTTRVGLFPGIEGLAMGFSVAGGGLRRGVDGSMATTDARRYEADYVAYGFDATYVLEDLGLRAYWYVSEEDLDGAPLKGLDRNGGTLDVLYTLAKQAPLFHQVRLKGRVSTAKDATLSEGSFRRSQYGLGFNAQPHEHFLLKAEYIVQDEHGVDEVKDNGFNVSGTVEF